MFFSSRDVPEDSEHPFGKLQSKKPERKVPESAMALRSKDVWLNIKTNRVPRSLTGLIQVFSHKTAASFEFSEPVAYLGYVA